MEFIEVKGGKNAGDVVLYALSTCVWCKKTRMLLDSLGVDFRYVYVDLLDDSERKRADEIVSGYNPDMSYPTVVIDGDTVIAGFDTARIREVLG